MIDLLPMNLCRFWVCDSITMLLLHARPPPLFLYPETRYICTSAVLTLAAPSSTFYTTASLFLFFFLFPSSLFISSRFVTLFLGCDGCPRRLLTFVH